MRNRKRFSIAYDTSQFSMNLLRGKRSFHFGLIVPDQIEAIPGNSADAVQNKDSLHTAIQNYIAACSMTASSRPGRKRGYIL